MVMVSVWLMQRRGYHKSVQLNCKRINLSKNQFYSNDALSRAGGKYFSRSEYSQESISA